MGRLRCPPPWSLCHQAANPMGRACVCLHPVQHPCLFSQAALIGSSLSPSWNGFLESSTLQEDVAWLKMSQTARMLRAIGTVEITGFGQLFSCVVTLLRLWINQGLCQTGWKSKVKAGHALVSLIHSLPPLPGCLFSHRTVLNGVTAFSCCRCSEAAGRSCSDLWSLQLRSRPCYGPQFPLFWPIMQPTPLHRVWFSCGWIQGWWHSPVSCTSRSTSEMDGRKCCIKISC